MYEERIIAYIDILGFTKKIENTVENLEMTQKIYDFISLVHKDFFKEIDKKEKFLDSSYEVTQSSDCLAISYVASEKASVFRMLMSLLYLQIDAIQNGLLLRGAVTCGKLIHDKTHLFGPAMNAVVDMEKNISIFPRIIVNKEVLEKAIENPFGSNGREDEEKYLKELLKTDFDGFYYIDYFLQGCEALMEEYGCECLPEYLKDICRIIDKNEQSLDIKIIQKTNWLKNNYNMLLANLKNDERCKDVEKELKLLKEYKIVKEIKM